MSFSIDWSYVHSVPVARGVLKSAYEDFQVVELMDEPFSGQGEHQLLLVQKWGVTTEDVAKSIARLINKPAKIISYAGLKDRQGLTTQWFSIHLPGETIEGIESLSGTNWKVLQATRHHKKLKIGHLAGNHFRITLRDVTHVEDALHRIETIKNTGVPNYFGEQRFGRGGNNLTQVDLLLKGQLKVKDRFLKGIYLSAARSFLFNQILSERVRTGTWNQALAGDVFQLAGSNSIFTAQVIDDTLIQRLLSKDIAPASPLFGKGMIKATQDALAVIEMAWHDYEQWLSGLVRMGLELAWRTHVIHPEAINYQISNNDLILEFRLPPGAYATSLLREIVAY